MSKPTPDAPQRRPLIRRAAGPGPLRRRLEAMVLLSPGDTRNRFSRRIHVASLFLVPAAILGGRILAGITVEPGDPVASLWRDLSLPIVMLAVTVPMTLRLLAIQYGLVFTDEAMKRSLLVQHPWAAASVAAVIPLGFWASPETAFRVVLSGLPLALDGAYLLVGTLLAAPLFLILTAPLLYVRRCRGLIRDGGRRTMTDVLRDVPGWVMDRVRAAARTLQILPATVQSAISRGGRRGGEA